MRSKKRRGMHEGVDRTELAVPSSAVERHDNTGNGALPETDANEVTGKEIEPVRNQVTERARRAANPREDRDLRGPRGHRS